VERINIHGTSPFRLLHKKLEGKEEEYTHRGKAYISKTNKGTTLFFHATSLKKERLLKAEKHQQEEMLAVAGLLLPLVLSAGQ
jgi:hypothetical protein